MLPAPGYCRYALALLACLAPAGLAAQDWTDDELKRRFEVQLETFRAVRDGTELGAARGLVLTNTSPAVDDAVLATGEAPAATEVGPAGDPVGYALLPDALQVNVRVNFAFDSAAIEASQTPKLRQLCKAMEDAGVQHFRIIGHTDATGADGYNEQLSVLRAEEVKRFFVSDCRIAATRLEAIGVGEQFLFNPGDPAAGVNRRVEFQAMS